MFLSPATNQPAIEKQSPRSNFPGARGLGGCGYFEDFDINVQINSPAAQTGGGVVFQKNVGSGGVGKFLRFQYQGINSLL